MSKWYSSFDRLPSTGRTNGYTVHSTANRCSMVGPDYIDGYKEKCLAEGVQLNTVAREVGVIKNLFNYAARNKNSSALT